jgi:hypothetical protein
MQESTATPETGPVDAPASMDSVLAEFETGNAPTDATDDVVKELVKDTEDEGQSDKEPDAEESATDPIEPEEESEEATPDEETDEDTPPADEPVHKVKVNGEELEVPLSELLKGYSRTEDYKSKTMALADERRQLEQAKATLEPTVRQQYANELKQRVDLFERLDPVLSEARQIDWDRLKAEDPATFVEYSDAVNQRLAIVQQHRAEIEKIEQEQGQAMAAQAQAERAQRLEIAANKIVETMPELAEGDNFQRFATDNIGYLRETGFTPEEITDAIDDRALILADKARKWDALQRAKQGLPAKKVVPKSKVKPMTTDGSDSSRSPKPRFPGNAPREVKGDWIADQILNSE